MGNIFGGYSSELPFNSTQGAGWHDVIIDGQRTSVFDEGVGAGKGKGSAANYGSSMDLMKTGLSMLNEGRPERGSPVGRPPSLEDGGGRGQYGGGSGASEVLTENDLTRGLNRAVESASGQNAPPPDQNRFMPYVPTGVGSSLLEGSYSPGSDMLTYARQFGSSPQTQTSLLSTGSSSLLGRY